MQEPVILLVEDNPDDEELTRLALSESGVSGSLVVARDGAAALDYLARPAGPAPGAGPGKDSALPQLVLLDLKLPKVDGLEVLRRLRADARTALLPVVILTSSDEEQDLLSGYRLGANSYVRKPVDFSKFTDVVRQLGEYWLSLNHPPPAPHRAVL